MRKILTFVCPELDLTYEDIYRELSLHLEMPGEEVIKTFSPDDAVSRLKYHRREASRRGVFQELALAMGVPVSTVFAACSADGARMLLDAMEAKRYAVA
jgi:hypothetical protein